MKKRALAALALGLFVAALAAAQALDATPRIAIMSAFGPEIVKLKANAQVEKVVVANGRSFTLCKIEGKEAVLFLSGESMVNAAMSARFALDNFAITHILFSGIAGGVNPGLDIGDVTVPARWAEYQESLYARAAAGGGYDLGWHKELYPGFGMAYPQEVEVTHGRLAKPDDIEKKFWFDVDPALLAVAAKIEDVQLASSTDKAKLSHEPKLVVGGSGLSGQAFVDNAEYRAWAFSTFKADCLDMESAAVAHVAYAAGVPFIAFRSLSDLAGGGPGENEEATFFGLAADNAAEVLLAFLKAWN